MRPVAILKKQARHWGFVLVDPETGAPEHMKYGGLQFLFLRRMHWSRVNTPIIRYYPYFFFAMTPVMKWHAYHAVDSVVIHSNA